MNLQHQIPSFLKLQNEFVCNHVKNKDNPLTHLDMVQQSTL